LFSKKSLIVYDSAELYIEKRKAFTLVNLKSNILIYLEKKYIKYVDLVIAANEDRSNLMQSYYELPNKPIVFENIYQINTGFIKLNNSEKIHFNVDGSKFNLIYSGGLNNFNLFQSFKLIMKDLGNEYYLRICGASDQKLVDDLSIWRKSNTEANIDFVGMLNPLNYRELIMKSDAAIAIYPNDTLNNIYCASGKVYETIFLNKPLIMSSNPPLKRIAEKFKVGIASDDIYNSIITIKNNYSFYKKNIELFNKSFDIQTLEMNLINSIVSAYKLKEVKS
jgi:hypothetical protein